MARNTMATSKELKEKVKHEIAALLEKYGKGADFSHLYKKYSDDVSKSTFYRWIRTIHSSGIPAQKAIRKAKQRVMKKAKSKQITNKKELGSEVSGEFIGALPIVPDASDVVGVSIIEMSRKLNGCMEEFESVIAHSKKKDGSIRNAKLLLQSVEGLRRTIDSATKLTESLWDIRRTEQFHKAIFNNLKMRDPVFVELVLGDLKQINKDWGIRL